MNLRRGPEQKEKKTENVFLGGFLRAPYILGDILAGRCFFGGFLAGLFLGGFLAGLFLGDAFAGHPLKRQDWHIVCPKVPPP